MITFQKTGGALSLSQKMMRGDDGGYYIPAVDENGNLTWTASDEDMAAIEGANIQGPAGPRGDAGVYVGTTEPDDEEVLIWINPEGTESATLATKEYVDEKIAAIEPEEVDLSDYALKTDIPDTSGFTTMAAVEEKGYQTEAQVNALITTALGVIENGTY